MNNKELFEKLQRFEKEFQWAVKQNFINMTRSDFQEIADAHKTLTGIDTPPSRLNCGSCRLKIMKTVADYYYKWVEENKKEEQPEEPKKKAGRPKKIDLNKEEDK